MSSRNVSKDLAKVAPEMPLNKEGACPAPQSKHQERL